MTTYYPLKSFSYQERKFQEDLQGMIDRGAGLEVAYAYLKSVIIAHLDKSARTQLASAFGIAPAQYEDFAKSSENMFRILYDEGKVSPTNVHDLVNRLGWISYITCQRFVQIYANMVSNIPSPSSVTVNINTVTIDKAPELPSFPFEVGPDEQKHLQILSENMQTKKFNRVMKAQRRSYEKWYRRTFALDLEEMVKEIIQSSKAEDDKLDKELRQKRKARKKKEKQRALAEEELKLAKEYEREECLRKFRERNQISSEESSE